MNLSSLDFLPDSPNVFYLSLCWITHPVNAPRICHVVVPFNFLTSMCLIFWWSPTLFSFSVHLYLYPHFLSVSIFILIFCLSPSLSPFSVCLCLFLCFLSVTIFLIFSQSLCMRRHTKNEDKGRDSQKMRTEMETNRKWRKRWRWAENKEKDGDKQKIKRMMDQRAETLAPSYKW